MFSAGRLRLLPSFAAAASLSFTKIVGLLPESKAAACDTRAKPVTATSTSTPPSQKKKKCIIIGGGVAGVVSAHELAISGVEVMVLEKSSTLCAECSAAPCGAIQRQSFPVIGAEDLVDGLKCIFSIGNEFKFARIDWWKTLSDPHFIRWALLFCHDRLWVDKDIHKARSENNLRYYEYSIDLLEELLFQKYEGRIGERIGCGRGALKPLRGPEALQKALAVVPSGEVDACKATSTVLSRKDALTLEPWLSGVGRESVKGECGANGAVSGALFQPEALSANCPWFTSCLADICTEKLGVRFQCNTAVTGFNVLNGRITAIHTHTGGTIPVPPDTDVVVTAGSWTPILMRKIDMFVPVYPMKGYTLSVTIDEASIPRTAIPQRIVAMDYLYMSRFKNQLRITSMGEFSGYDTKPNESVVTSIKRQASHLFPSHSTLLENTTAQVGLRPCVYDNSLIAGQVSHLQNLYVNVGPSQTAWKGCMGSARIITAAVTKRTDLLPDSFDSEAYSPDCKVVKSPFFCKVADMRYRYA